MSTTRRLGILIALLALAPLPIVAQPFPEPEPEPEPEVEEPPEESPIDPRFPAKRDAGPFSRGTFGLSVTAGNTFLGSRSYLQLGAGLGFHVLTGLEMGLDGALWLFDDPTAGTLTPRATYTFHFVPVVKPYVGTFVRHYMVGSNIDDFDSYGFRTGVYIVPLHSRVHFGAGVLYERLFDCGNTVWTCDDLYPEVNLAISFGGR